MKDFLTFLAAISSELITIGGMALAAYLWKEHQMHWFIGIVIVYIGSIPMTYMFLRLNNFLPCQAEVNNDTLVG